MFRRADGSLIVSATDLVGFLACGHLTHLERAAAAGLVKKPIRNDPEVELLQRRGGLHEDRYIAQLEANSRTITRLDADRDRSYEERAAETIAAMQRGDDIIYQATVFDGRWVGHPDFLLRVGEPGTLGQDHHYSVADTKLAHSAKASALIQICSYVDQVQRIQGIAPEWVYVVTGGAEVKTHPFRTAEMMAYYRHAKRRFEEAVDDAVSGPPTYPMARTDSYPDPVDHCSVCRWSPDFCRRAWRDDDALPLVAGITRTQRQVLTVHSVTTMRALSELEQPVGLGLKRTQGESMWKMREQARLQVLSVGLEVPVYELLPPARDSEDVLVPDRGLSALPQPSDGDLFFDIEGDPFAFWEGMEYLFGVWGADGEWQSFWALNRDQEKRAFERVMDMFVERWRSDPDMHIYHYAPYEPTALKRLAGRHSTRQAELDKLLSGRVFVDLYRVVRQGLRAGVERYSIKNLEDLYGFKREVNLRDANSSIVEFEKILEIGDPDGTLKEQIEAYNRDDCVSAAALRGWLEQLRVEAARQFGPELPRPREEPPAPEEAKTDWEMRLSNALTMLTSNIPADLLAQTDADKTTWLLANLLDWHRREDKAAWWRFFELLTMSDDELFEEQEPIGRLSYEGVIDVKKSGNKVHRYRFPPQEHRVGNRSELYDPLLPPFSAGDLGKGVIDREGLTLDIVRLPDWSGPHPRSVVPVDRIPIDGLQEALLRVADWVAANGLEAEVEQFRAVQDLLRRSAPRIGGGSESERLVCDGELGSEAAQRLAPALEATTLAIQGPPGSGKTYSGARMIIALVRAGRRVGVTGSSHKVVTNLLDAVWTAAKQEGLQFDVLQRIAASDREERPWQTAKDNGPFDRLLRDGDFRVVAGTVWLWARKEMWPHEDNGPAVDTLFVDEAGQVALANVVAAGGAARNIVLLGDPQQLDQVLQGSHPPGAEKSALGHFLGESEVIPETKGLFLEKTWRMHPDITAFTSEQFYEGALTSVAGLSNQRVLGNDSLSGSGLRWVPMDHQGRTNASEEEADRVREIWTALVGRQWVDMEGAPHEIGPEDVVIVSPFNAHRLLIQERLPDALVGTVDKFQGQEAPVSIYTMATSRPEDAPRGLSFLYSLNRLNVATSRARALTVVVASRALLLAVPQTPDQLRMANGLCAFVERAG